MSAYKLYDCSIVDKAVLLEALKELGLSPVCHEVPAPLHGYQGEAREEVADIIVSRRQLNAQFTGCSNDLGFAWNAESERYDVICSDYDAQHVLLRRVVLAYSKVAIEHAMRDSGFNVNVEKGKNLKTRKRCNVKMVGTKLV